MDPYAVAVILLFFKFVLLFGGIYLLYEAGSWFFRDVWPGLRLPKARRALLREEMAYLHAAAGPPRPPMTWNRELRRALNHRRDLDRNLHLLMGDILEHMGVQGVSQVKLFVVHSVFDSHTGGGRAGTYQRTGSLNEIEIFVRRDYTFWQLAAILSHECAHLYLDRRGIRARPGRDQEELTDLTAIHLGFGGALRKGYRHLEKTLTQGNAQTTSRSKIGYLSLGDIAYAGRQLDRAAPEPRYRKAKSRPAGPHDCPAGERGRPPESERPPEPTPGNRERAKLQKGLAVRLTEAEGLYRRLLNRAEAAKAGPRDTLTPEDWQRIQEVYRAIEGAEISSMVRRSQQSAETLSADQLRRRLEELGELCLRHQDWITFLGRCCK